MRVTGVKETPNDHEAFAGMRVMWIPDDDFKRLLLGSMSCSSKRAMSEAELHVLRASLNGGIQNKAARGELRRGLPIGFVWGEGDAKPLLDLA